MNISVVIPCFNRERRIAAAIESALAQTAPPSEVIVIDDGSTDRSAAVAASMGPPVRVIRSENRGPGAARNAGIEAARGDWIAFLDSDDEWHPQKLELQRRAIAHFDGVDLVFCDTRSVAADRVAMPSRFALGGVYGSETERWEEFLTFDRSLFATMLERSRVITSAVLVRRGLKGLWFDESLRVSQDWQLWLVLALHYRFAAVDRILVTMHFDGDNQTARISRILRHDVLVLEGLLQLSSLTDCEREAVSSVLARRRVAAMYHSLVRGETVEARQLLRQIPVATLGRTKHGLYRLVGRMPSPLIRTIGRLRGAV
jgi:glycosyltransferase involved in cell wall biosynthesis